jgi:hypothetical protein
MLKHEGLEYKDLGVDYFDRLEPERLRSYLVKRLQRLGYRGTERHVIAPEAHRAHPAPPLAD